MTPPEESKEQDPQRQKADFVRIVTWAVIAALFGAIATFLILAPGDDPDRPPIIVRDGSVIVTEDESDVRGELKHASGKTWYHEHAHKGPRRLNAFVVGVAGNSCGSGGTNFVSNVKKVIVTYSLGDASRQIELLIRGKRIEIDVISGPDPTNVDAWTLSFDAEGARLTEVRLEVPNGAETCTLDPGAGIVITQHK